MSQSKTLVKQYYSINITLTREFLKWVHTHRLLDGAIPFHDDLWMNRPDQEQFAFCGKYGTQFKTIDEASSFVSSFDDLLVRKGIDDKHKHNLWYLIRFLNQDFEKQSIENNRNNHLHDYAKFILDLIANCLSHFRAMEKNPAYGKVHDEITNEVFFAKTGLIGSMPIEELWEYVPDEHHADDIVKYLRIDIYDDELYVPDDFILNIKSKQTLKNLMGETIEHIALPANLRYGVFTYMINQMLQQHKKYNTDFYQEMIKDSMLTDFKGMYKKYKRHQMSIPRSLATIGHVVRDYLLMHNIYTKKSDIADFLFEYFALFKAIKVKTKDAFPVDYKHVIGFYRDRKVNKETIRLIMKEFGEI